MIDLIVIVVVIAVLAVLIQLITRHMGITIPQPVIVLFWVLVVAIVAIFFLRSVGTFR